MEKYGFVYIWWDKKKNKYYIGCHWGTEDDGYTCSSVNMYKAYKRRPEDFAPRRTLKIVPERESLLIEEHKWLQLIPKEELGKKYYNLKTHLFASGNLGKYHKEDHKRKISESIKKKWQDPEYKEKNIRINFRHSEESKQKMSKDRKGKTYEERFGDRAEEIAKKISNSQKLRNWDYKRARKGKIKYMTNGTITKVIPKEYTIPEGWSSGKHWGRS